MYIGHLLTYAAYYRCLVIPYYKPSLTHAIAYLPPVLVDGKNTAELRRN